MEDDATSLILHGCKLANDLEVSLPYLANQPTLLSKSCEDIIAIFSVSKQRIERQSPHFFHKQQHPRMWKQLFGTCPSPSILIPQSTYMAGPSGGSRSAGACTERRDAGTGVTVAGVISPRIPAADVSKERAPSQRRRRRNNGEDRWTVKTAAPTIGNVEIPPEDGYTWRKYGQKNILGSKFPRGYFRCTHRKLYRCPAKKQVQRLDNDPSTFEVTYRHRHTCHVSSTAPSALSPSLLHLISQDTTHLITTIPSQPPLTSTASSSSLGMPIGFDIGGPSVTRSMNVGGNVAGPSAGVEAECRLAATIGDMVFNHGASHNSAVEFVFPYMEERWKLGEQK